MKFAYYFNEVIYKGLLNVLGVKSYFHNLAPKNVLAPEQVKELVFNTKINQSWVDEIVDQTPEGNDESKPLIMEEDVIKLKQGKSLQDIANFSLFDLDSNGCMLYSFIKTQGLDYDNLINDEENKLRKDCKEAQKIFKAAEKEFKPNAQWGIVPGSNKEKKRNNYNEAKNKLTISQNQLSTLIREKKEKLFGNKVISNEDLKILILKYLNNGSYNVNGTDINISIELKDLSEIIELFCCQTEITNPTKEFKNIFKQIEYHYRNDKKKLSLISDLKIALMTCSFITENISYTSKFNNMLEYQKYKLYKIHTSTGERNTDNENVENRYYKDMVKNPKITKKVIFANRVKNFLDNTIFLYSNLPGFILSIIKGHTPKILTIALLTVVNKAIGSPIKVNTKLLGKHLLKAGATSIGLGGLTFITMATHDDYKHETRQIENKRAEIEKQKKQPVNAPEL
ncbi:MAG: hypothetical protein J0H68_02915 [Sphingobacteriia bacterium]|nr:hypothetical protein [Sphingobacteriia bacterium]